MDVNHEDACRDRLFGYLANLRRDTYPQPADAAHTYWTRSAIYCVKDFFIPDCASVLDVGCGSGHAAADFGALGLRWKGIAIGADVLACREAGLDVEEHDMTLMPFEDGSWDLVFARHVLEHSPMPVVTLMEWRRVARLYLLLVAPAPEYWGYRGRNHYSVLSQGHLDWLLARAGWAPFHRCVMHLGDEEFAQGLELTHGEPPPMSPDTPVELRYLCSKVHPLEE